MKAIALISGGLDSALAAKLIIAQGIDVIPLKFRTPFEHNHNKKNRKKLRWAKDCLGKKIRTIDISSEFLKLLMKPKYGFGKNMNPCIACKILMLKKAKELMKHLQARFVITGEVLGQRPMSQNKQALINIEKESGLEGLLLRPLSAKLLPETIPEQKNWINRRDLLDIIGRRRKPQEELAKQFNIKNYPNPAGGCLLTDPEFSKRLKDLISHEGLNLNNVELLKLGRHFRLTPKAKLVIGRDEKENERLTTLAQNNDYLFDSLHVPGPVALGRGDFDKDLVRLSCSVVSHYCDLNGKSEIDIACRKIPEEERAVFKIQPIAENQLGNLRI